MSGEGVSDQHLCSGAGIEQALVGGFEEALVGVKTALEQLVEEFSKDPTAIYPCFVQTVGI